MASSTKQQQATLFIEGCKPRLTREGLSFHCGVRRGSLVLGLSFHCAPTAAAHLADAPDSTDDERNVRLVEVGVERPVEGPGGVAVQLGRVGDDNDQRSAGLILNVAAGLDQDLQPGG